MFEILDTQLEVTEQAERHRVGMQFAGRVEFRDVSFAYGKNPPLLRDIGFTIEPGGTLALVGASGSGKSTLINLIPRFYDVTAGAVLTDGHDVRDVQLKSLRSQVGMVMQETFLFNATIRENICYGREDASTPRKWSEPPVRPTRMISSWSSPTATIRWWASTVSACRAASASASLSPVRSWWTLAS